MNNQHMKTFMYICSSLLHIHSTGQKTPSSQSTIVLLHRVGSFHSGVFTVGPLYKKPCSHLLSSLRTPKLLHTVCLHPCVHAKLSKLSQHLQVTLSFTFSQETV